MNKKYREGLDIEIAFSSSARRHAGEDVHKNHAASDPISKAACSFVSNTQLASSSPGRAPLSLRGRVKRILKVPVRFLYHLIKPVAKPIVFRLRRYIIEEFRQQLLQEIRHVTAATVNNAQETRAAVRQELKESRDLIRQEVLNIQTKMRQEMQQSPFTMLEVTQGHVSNLLSSLNRVEQYTAATARRVAVNCGDSEILIKTQVGYILCSATDHAVVACLVDTGELELGTRLLIQRFLQPGDVFVDVGANLGMHTLAAARAMSGQGKIIAFEPFEKTKRLLEKSVWMNGFSGMAEIHQAAVSNTSGQKHLFLGATSGHHSLYPLGTSMEPSSESVEVSIVRLDEAIGSGQKVDLVKIDAEGAELEVLDGGTSVVVDNPDIALIVEFGPSHLKRTGHTTAQWLESFTRHELVFKAIHPETGVLEDWTLEQLEKTESVNLFFARVASSAWERTAQ